MADCNPSAILVLLGSAADVVEGHVVGVRPEVEVHVDVHIEFSRHLEDTIDLPVRIGIGVRCRTDRVAAALERLDHQFVGAWIIDEALLRKHTYLKIDGPGIIPYERLYAVEAAQSDTGIDLEVRAHVSGPVQDGFFERACRARPDVLWCEGGFCFCSFADRPFEIAARRAASIEDAGFIEMNMALNKARRREPPGRIDHCPASGHVRRNGGNTAA